MAWRIVQQPSGKFARFSEVVDNFTHYDLTEIEAYELCRDVMRVEEAKGKVQRAKENPHRFEEALKTIRIVHGIKERDKVKKLVR